jgi:hypothetical protein
MGYPDESLPSGLLPVPADRTTPILCDLMRQVPGTTVARHLDALAAERASRDVSDRGERSGP